MYISLIPSRYGAAIGYYWTNKTNNKVNESYAMDYVLRQCLNRDNGVESVVLGGLPQHTWQMLSAFGSLLDVYQSNDNLDMTEFIDMYRGGTNSSRFFQKQLQTFETICQHIAPHTCVAMGYKSNVISLCLNELTNPSAKTRILCITDAIFTNLIKDQLTGKVALFNLFDDINQTTVQIKPSLEDSSKSKESLERSMQDCVFGVDVTI
ncbi:hypothetical protein RFI_13142 [Reticulomyxa filosa]|uniref:Uncharacterized protein n=1 Tax=Reticulomyxa filosa TaxID=46433 RepID=X6NDE9_RETFI|nr:hypothetical protein RFI_13142 [Reticulomyxa filosa]|eukprot:ETO24016.1 hypothetical protein RFI_13142 [Reticulomyxa filosa]